MPAEVRNPNLKYSADFWRSELGRIGQLDNVLPFHTIQIEYNTPTYFGEPVLSNVVLNGQKCDVYHSDKKGNPHSDHILLIHIKK